MERIKELWSKCRIAPPDYFSRIILSKTTTSTTTTTTKEVPRKNRSFWGRIEALLVKYQELSLWNNPWESSLALIFVQLTYWYLIHTSNSVINLTAWTALLAFVYTTWTQRLWPEIRVEPEHKPDEEENFTPLHPDVYSAPEVERIFRKVSDTFREILELRRENPGKFCAICCLTFSVLAYIGTFISGPGLVYVFVTGSLIFPALFKRLVKHIPKFKLLEARPSLVVAEDEDEYLPTSDDNVLEEPLMAESPQDIYREASFLTGLESFPSHEELDESDDLKTEDEFLPTTHSKAVHLDDEDLDDNDSFSLPTGQIKPKGIKDAKELQEDDYDGDDDEISEEFEMISNDELNTIN